MPLVQILILGLERGEHVEILIFGKPTQITGYIFLCTVVFLTPTFYKLKVYISMYTRDIETQ